MASQIKPFVPYILFNLEKATCYVVAVLLNITFPIVIFRLREPNTCQGHSYSGTETNHATSCYPTRHNSGAMYNVQAIQSEIVQHKMPRGFLNTSKFSLNIISSFIFISHMQTESVIVQPSHFEPAQLIWILLIHSPARYHMILKL